jgi:hypothetical protein
MVDDFRKWGAESFGESLFCVVADSLMRQNFRGLANRQRRG